METVDIENKIEKKQQRENSLYRITRTSQYYFKSEIISMTPRRL